MKFAFITLDFRRFSLKTCFQMAQRYGFDGIELWGGRPHAYPMDLTPQCVGEIRAYKRDYGIQVPMYTPNVLGTHINLCAMERQTQRDSVEFFQRAIQVAENLEIPHVLLVADHPGYYVSLADARARFAENVQNLGEFARPRGIKLTIEPLTPMESPVVTTADDCLQIIQLVGLPNIHGMLDVVPPTVVHEPLSNYFDKLGDRMSYIHLANTDGKGDGHFALDRGILSIPDLIRVFQKRNYNGYVTMEFYSEGFYDPEVNLANAVRILQQTGVYPLRQ